MKKVLLVVVILLAVAGAKVAMKKFDSSDSVSKGERRVKLMFENQQKATGGDGYEMTALSEWAMGVENLSDARNYTDRYDRWRQAKGIYKLESWSFVKAESDPQAPDTSALVTCTLNGKDLVMRVRKDQPIEWAE